MKGRVNDPPLTFSREDRRGMRAEMLDMVSRNRLHKAESIRKSLPVPSIRLSPEFLFRPQCAHWGHLPPGGRILLRKNKNRRGYTTAVSRTKSRGMIN